MRPTDQLRQDQMDALAEAMRRAADEIRALAVAWAKAWDRATEKVEWPVRGDE